MAQRIPAWLGSVALAALLALLCLLLASAAPSAAGTPDLVGQWSAVQAWPLVAVHSALEPNGGVLVWDAFDNAPNSERLWNPATGTFTAVPYARNLFCSGHVELGDGRNIVFGGHIDSNVGLQDTTLFNPTTQTWTRGPDMSVGRWYPTATTLGDGRVLVISGDNMILGRSGVPQPFVDTSNTLPEIYDPATNTITDLTSARRFIPLYPFMFVMPDGRVFDAGPDTINRALDVNTGTWTTIANSPIDGGSAVMYRAGKILKTGTWGDPGVDYPGDGRAAVIDLNQPTPAWREVAPMANTRQFHNLVMLPDGTVFAVGGATRGGGINSSFAVLTPELWNPVTETWTSMAPMQTPRMYHSTSLLLPDGRVLVAGGGRKGGATDYPSAEIYSPPYLFKGARPLITAAPASATYGSTIDVTTPDASSIASVSLIRNASMTHAFDENQRFLALSFTQGSGKVQVTLPANGNLAPPGSYNLFVVNGNGVPSVGVSLRLQATPTDTTPPTVSITAPAAGATVVGTTNVTASAGDNVAVATVQFKLDGSNLGALDTTAPYAVSWDSATTTNGQHTLTAVATDSSGNTTTASGVQVAVNNVSPSGLVGAWGFDEGSGTTASDRSGNNNNGTLSNATWSTAGKFGNAISFNGTSSWVTVSDSSSLDLTNGMTLEAWVKPAALGTVWRTVAFKETTNNLVYDLYANTSTTVPDTSVNIAGEQELRGPAALPLNAWSHLASSYDGSTLRLYVNGTQVASKPLAGSMVASTGALRIGGNNVYPEWFSGLIDEVRVYRRALSAAEIQSDMNQSISTPDSTPPSAPGTLTAAGALGSATLSWGAATDNVAVARYDVYRSTSSGFTPGPSNLVGTTAATGYTDTGLAAGNYYYRVAAEDASSNIGPPSNEAGATVAGDTTPPTISITAPAGGATVSGTATTVSATASDNSTVFGVVFKVDGTAIGAEDTTSPYSVSWDTTTVGNGPHTLTAVARDPAGNSAASAPVQVTVNNTTVPGLVAAYAFDELSGPTTADQSGNGNTGTLSNATRTTSGKYGSALSFNGTNSLVSVADSSSLDLTNGMTLEAWVKPAANGTTWRTVIFKQQAADLVYGLYENRNTTVPNAQVFVGGAAREANGTAAVPIGAWTHLAATYDGNVLALYRDGTQVSTLVVAGTISTSTGALTIGGNNIWPEWFSGQIDEVRVYNRALNAAQIQADMTKPVGTPDTTAPTTPTNLVGTGSLGSGMLNWGGSTDDVGVARYNVHRSTTSGFTPAPANRIAQPTGTSYTDNGLAAGTYYYKVTAEDAAGNVSGASNEASLVVTADTTPPTVSITAPAGGATVSNTVSVTASASDAGGVAGVQFTLDGSNLGSEDTTAPYSASWDTRTASNGAHTLAAVAHDLAGNAATASSVSVTVANAGLPPGLVASYGFEEGSGTTTADASGNNNQGTLTNGAGWAAAGKHGKAATFDGVNDFVSVADSSSLDLTTGMTLEAWVNPAALGTAWRTVIFKQQPGDLVYGLYANRNTKVPLGQIFVGGSERDANGTAQLPLNQWSHLAATYDGSTLKVWLNGAQVGTLAIAGAIPASTGPFLIGGDAVFSEWFQGSIDDVLVYNRALSQTEIQADMNRNGAG